MDALDQQAMGEGDAINKASQFQSKRPTGSKRAPLIDVPFHLRARRGPRRPLPELVKPPVVPARPIPDWMKRQHEPHRT